MKFATAGAATHSCAPCPSVLARVTSFSSVPVTGELYPVAVFGFAVLHTAIFSRYLDIISASSIAA